MYLSRILSSAMLGIALLASHAHAAINASQLGASYDASKANVAFKVYSGRATRIELYLYSSASGSAEKARYPMTLGSAGVWAVSLPVATLSSKGITGTIYYGYRAWGPNWPYVASWTPGSAAGFVSDVDANGNRFNPNKLLLDPYALEMSHDPTTASQTNGTVYASGALYRNLDSGPAAPKGIVLAGDTQSTGSKPTRAFKDDIVYEIQVRGLTKSDTSIASAYRGTYKGAGLKAPYLASLGVTAVEFLPVQETQNDTNDNEPANNTRDNYWGYMTLNYFAPDRRYAADKSAGGPTREFKEMVKAFHDQGIKVLIDVVYNHTGEGGAWNAADKTTYNVMSWRGLDNPTYYSLTTDKQSSWDNTGVGGNYNTRNPVAQNLIVDSLAYWRDKLGVDGYRFDLASVLGNTCEHGCFNFDKMDAANALNRIVGELPPRPAGGGAGIDLIAEPWAIGGNSYQVGGFPSGWAEWNGAYRDTVRAVQNKLGSVAVTPGQLASRMAGSSDLFGDDGRKPLHSVNFITAHDGFALKCITQLSAVDIRYAEQLGYRIKLLGITKRRGGANSRAGGVEGIELRVHPTLVPVKRLIANVEGAMNAVMVQGDAVGSTLYYGKGAGAEPTASAVIADLVDITRLHTADPDHRVPHLAFQPGAMRDTRILPMADVVTAFYLRLQVADQAGVLARITAILADRDISIDALLQRESAEGEAQTDVIILTHDTVEGRMNQAIAQMQALPTVLAPIVRIRKEELS